jgi:hypothetical protein
MVISMVQEGFEAEDISNRTIEFSFVIVGVT